MKRNHTITLTKSSIGSSCVSPQIEWEKPAEGSCVNIVCLKDNGWTVEISREEDCQECITAIITCPDQCSTCEPVRKTYCPCDSSTECGDCEECGPNGLCESKCEEGQICDGVICKDCTDPSQCPGDQVCVSGGCGCPPDRPIALPNGRCVQCDANNPPPACYDCENGVIVPRDCGTGTCDPNTDTCVECTKDGDCGPGRRCFDNNCECLPGLVLDANGDCVPGPGCDGPEDCGECEVCSESGCIPVECPPGYVCGGRDVGCIPECDCDNPDCSGTRGCAQTPSGDCGCYACPSDCSEGCGENCYCDESEDRCLPNPCADKPCESGLDCGEDCGCDDETKRCVPCASLSCPNGDCDKVLGCGCDGNGTCGPTRGCSGSCADANDCDGPCGCKDGLCVDCSELPCATCGNTDGCGCSDGKTCESDDPSGCQDQIRIVKNDENCELEGSLKIEGSCACPAISQYVKMNTVRASNGTSLQASFTISLHKGFAQSPSDVGSLPRLDDSSDPSVAENEEPVTAAYAVEVITKVRRDADSVIYTASRERFTVSLSGLAVATSPTFQVYKPGATLGDGKVSSVEYSVKRTGVMSFPNSCEYGGQSNLISKKIATESAYNGLVAASQGLDVATSAGTRFPILTWSRSLTGTFGPSDVIRSVYTPVSGGRAVDTLRGPEEVSPSGAYPVPPGQGGLYANHHYLLVSDCGCDRATSIGPVVFCNPKPLVYEAKECNTKVEIKRPFMPCDVNKFSGPPSAAAVKYELYLDNVKVSTWQFSQGANALVNASGSSIFTDYKKPDNSSIKTIKVVQVSDSASVCDMVYNLPAAPEIELNYTAICQGVSGYQLTIPVAQGNTQIVSLLSTGSSTVTRNSNSYTVTAEGGATVNLSIEFANGCNILREISEDCCSALTVSIENRAKACSQETRLVALDAAGAPHAQVRWTLPDNTVRTSNPLIAAGPLPGLYKAQVGDESCFETASFDLQPAAVFTVELPEDISICSGETADIDIQAVPGSAAALATVNYDVVVNGNITSGTITLDAFGRASIRNIGTAAEYVFKEAFLEGCQVSINQTVTIELISEPTATLSTKTPSVCVGDSVEIKVEGTPGAEVNVSGYGIVAIPSTGTALINVTPRTSQSYSVTSVQLGECVNNGGGSISVVVRPRPATPSVVSQNCNSNGTQLTIVASSFTEAFAVNAQGVESALTVSSNTVVVSRLDFVSVKFVNRPTEGCETVLDLPIGDCVFDELNGTLVGAQICDGDEAVLTVQPPTNGSGSYTYLWSNGQTGPSITVSPSATVSYNVTITDTVNGATQSLSATVSVITAQPVQIDVVGTLIDVCIGTPRTVSVVNPQQGTVYQWYQDNQLVFTGANYTITASASVGVFDLKVVASTPSGSCTSESEVYKLYVHDLDLEITEQVCQGQDHIIRLRAESSATTSVQFVIEAYPIGTTSPIVGVAASGAVIPFSLVANSLYRITVYPFDGSNPAGQNSRPCTRELTNVLAACDFTPTLSLVEGNLVASIPESQGCVSPTYTWKRDGVTLVGENASSLDVFNNSTGVYTVGSYEVTVNCGGTEGVASAELHDVQIQEQLVNNGTSDVPGLKALITGTCLESTITWRKSGVLIEDSIVSVDRTEVELSGNGNYNVTVTCANGFTITKSIFVNQ